MPRGDETQWTLWAHGKRQRSARRLARLRAGPIPPGSAAPPSPVARHGAADLNDALFLGALHCVLESVRGTLVRSHRRLQEQWSREQDGRADATGDRRPP